MDLKCNQGSTREEDNDRIVSHESNATEKSKGIN